MRTAIWFIAAVCAYFISGINLSIILSKLIYHEDIREKGSKNPGFTNFKRVYGNKYAWFIFAYDLIKGAALAALYCLRALRESGVSGNRVRVRLPNLLDRIAAHLPRGA